MCGIALGWCWFFWPQKVIACSWFLSTLMVQKWDLAKDWTEKNWTGIFAQNLRRTECFLCRPTFVLCFSKSNDYKLTLTSIWKYNITRLFSGWIIMSIPIDLHMKWQIQKHLWGQSLGNTHNVWFRHANHGAIQKMKNFIHFFRCILWKLIHLHFI